MCGITGYLRLQKDTHEGDLKNIIAPMTDAVHHRGPDNAGYWIKPELGLAFGHRRLSIIDTSSGGAQPMVSQNGQAVLTYNGEIYNFAALRAELMQVGAAPVWRGHSDTEILLAAFQHWGVEKTLPKLNGMFAFAYADLATRKLYLARDRFGEKPLYIYRDAYALAFASELKAFRTLPHFDNTINRAAVSEFMAYAYIPQPRSIYERAQKLPPASFVTVDLTSNQISAPITYWSARDVAAQARKNLIIDEVAAIKQLDELLRQSIQLRMMADVPLGAFLSGGIDSSTVVALMQAQSTQPIKTYAIGFAEASYNEAPHARAVAQHLGTNHTEHVVTAAEAMAVIPQLPEMYDEPFADSSQIPTYLVSKLARRDVTVSLSGDAGDELFGGYNRYVMGPKLWRALSIVPAPLRAAAAHAITSVTPHNYDKFHAALADIILPLARLRSIGEKIHKLASLLEARNANALYQSMHTFWPLGNIVNDTHGQHKTVDTVGTFADDMMLHDTINYLPDDILVKLDRASMAVSLESRVPLLDPDLFAFAWSLAPDLKIRNAQGKYLLRQVLHQYVPKDLIDRPKMGFGVPIGDWLRGQLRDWAEELLSPATLAQDDLLIPAPIIQKWQEHLSGRRNWQHHLWPVLMLQAWRTKN